MDGFLAAFDERIGLDRLVIDSTQRLASPSAARTLDRHEHLGAGRIGAAGLAQVAHPPGLARTAYYLETPGMDEGYDAVNVARAYDTRSGPAARQTSRPRR